MEGKKRAKPKLVLTLDPKKDAGCARPTRMDSRLFAYDFHQHTLSSESIEFTVENLLPWPEIETPFSDSDDDLPTHHGALQVRVRIVFPAVMSVLRMRFFGSEFFEPFLQIG